MKPLRDLGIKRLWFTVKSPNSSSGSQCEQGKEESPIEETKPGPNCSLPLLQVWPSSDSPRGEADGQSFIFPICTEERNSQHSTCFGAADHHNDSGIESTQVSPSPLPCSTSSPVTSPALSVRRPSSALLHPDHARLLRFYPTSSPDHSSLEDVSECLPNNHISPSSSTTSSLTSVAAAVSSASGSRTGPRDSIDSRRRSSSMTARYSLFDALDLEYALLRAAARGSIGPYSLGESLHKLTFTQSLAFPALARGMAGKRRRSQETNNTRLLNPSGSSLHAFAKVVTVLVLVLVSVLVFAVVYKFVRT